MSKPQKEKKAVGKATSKKAQASVVQEKFHFDKNTFRPPESKTQHQQDVISAYRRGCHLIMSGAAGSGKTYLALALALEESIESNFKKKIVIVRSVVPTRDMGFLPGDQSEKEAAYMTPYINLINEMCASGCAYRALSSLGVIKFITTSFIRGITLNNSIIIVDEFQNCFGRELDSIMTRIGNESRIVFSGDTEQSDFDRSGEKQGAGKFLSIITDLNNFEHVQFTWDDCVRSGTCRDYLMSKARLGISF